MSLFRPLQELQCLNENLEGSVFRPLRSKLKRRPSCGGGLDTENTPHELIQQWSPPHKKPVISVKGKENDENVFVLGRRPRKRRESSGLFFYTISIQYIVLSGAFMQSD